MALVKPFKAVRPKKELAHLIAALPYDVMDRSEAANMAKGNPYSFLHVDRAEIDLDRSVDSYDKKVYEKARQNLYNMIKKGFMVQDGRPYLYIYRLVMGGMAQTGIVGCTSIDEYMDNTIRKHEHTREDKEQDRINHVDYCNANTGPIFLTYRHEDEIDDIVSEWTKREPVYSFTAEDGVSHIVWVIDDSETIGKLQSHFKGVEHLYIADGHHRAASAVKVGLKRRKQGAVYTAGQESDYFLSVIFPDRELRIMDYNRVVKDINGLTEEEFLNKVFEKFDIQKLCGNDPCRPQHKHEFGMYIGGSWYELTCKEGTYDGFDPVGRLDVSILQDNLLKPVLGIVDPRKDERIDFVGGIRGLKELQERVDKGGMKVAFSMYPTSIRDLMDIADEGMVMPPKSTWFEPKLRSGIFIHMLE